MEKLSKKLKMSEMQKEIQSAKTAEGNAAVHKRTLTRQKQSHSRAEDRAVLCIGESEPCPFTQRNLSTAITSELGGEMVGVDYCFQCAQTSCRSRDRDSELGVVVPYAA